MQWVNKDKPNTGKRRPDNGEVRLFKKFAFFPVSFYSHRSKLTTTIWLEWYEVEMTYYRRTKEKFDYWGNITLTSNRSTVVD